MNRRLDACRYCGLLFLPVDWLRWRQAGLCSQRCADAECKALFEEWFDQLLRERMSTALGNHVHDALNE